MSPIFVLSILLQIACAVHVVRTGRPLYWIFILLIGSFIGVAMFWGSFLIVDKLTPYDLWKELVESRNTALAMVVAATHLGIAIIVAAAIH